MYTKNNVQDKPICHSTKPSQTYDQEIRIGINLNYLFLPIQKKYFKDLFKHCFLSKKVLITVHKKIV